MVTKPGLKNLLNEEYSNYLEDVTRIAPRGPVTIRCCDRIISEREFTYVDKNFFDFFSFRLLKGDKNKVLNNPYSAVLTEKTANPILPFYFKICWDW